MTANFDACDGPVPAGRIPVPAERRERLDLREKFDAAVAVLRPFFDIKSGAPLENWAMHALREAYPDLDSQGFQILFEAARRACVSGRVTQQV